MRTRRTKVFGALLVFTLIEYFWAHVFKDSFAVLLLGLLFWAVIKASMVGWFFMHLKFEGNWVYFMLIPAGILACVLTFALIPDVAMQPVTEENPAEEESTPVSLLETPGDGEQPAHRRVDPMRGTKNEQREPRDRTAHCHSA